MYRQVKKIIPVVLIFLLIITSLLLPFFLKVKIRCKSQYGACPADLERELKSFENNSLYRSKKEIRKKLSQNFLISDFSTRFKLPNVLIVDLIIKKPIFALRDPNSGQSALVGLDGTIVSITQDSTLPHVVTPLGEAKVGDNVGNHNLAALKLVVGVFNMYQVDEGKIENDTLVVELPSQIKVIFPLGEEVDLLLGSLRLIYSKIQSEGEGKYSQIDLRFKNPVLR